MNVVYLTDIHDNFAGVSSVLNQTEADLYILSGDLTYHCFGTDEALFRFIELQENIRAGTGTKDEEYKKLASEALQELQRKYQTMNKAIVATQKKCFIIPGNYDISLDGTAVAPYSLHEKTQSMGGVKFAGYGSAPIFTPGIPEELTVEFEETGSGNTLKSKPMEFMRREKADVFVLHNPPYGTLDKLPRYGHCGSQGLRQAVDEVQPRLVLSGHVHESYGLMKLGPTYFLNPSNFGSVEALEGRQEGGYFCTFQLQADGDGQKFLRDVTWKRLVGGSIVDICNVKIDKKQRATETILNNGEYDAMGKFLL